jgi:hypothetical protein
MTAHGTDEALGTGYAEVGTLCIVTIQVDHSSESNLTTQVGTTKKRVVPGRRSCIGTLGRTPQVPAVLHCKYTVEPERFNLKGLYPADYVSRISPV